MNINMANKRSDDPLFTPLRHAREIVSALVEAIMSIKGISREEREHAVKALQGLPLVRMAKIIDDSYTKPIGSGKDEQTPLAPSIKEVISKDRPSNIPRDKKK